MELTQLIQRAQEALDRGEFYVVDAACRHALATYPTCLSAHRLLGEACLEHGRVEEAVERFELALVLDPLDFVAYLGLGMAAEERGDLQAASMHYLRAWEINPSLDRLRDELVRLQQALRGEGRLHRSRAGLASLYARTGQLTRAVAEWRAVVAADAENMTARTALIDVLWRQGEDAAALVRCREVLAAAPETARVLAILADLEQRRALPAATTTAATYRSLDPSGEILASLLALKPQANLDWLLPEPAMVPPFDFEAAARLAPRPIESADLVATVVEQAPTVVPPLGPADRGTPAPDVWDSLMRDMGADVPAVAGIDEVAPFAWPADDTGGEDAALDANLVGVVPFDVASIEGAEAGGAPADILAAPSLPGGPPTGEVDPLVAFVTAEAAALHPTDPPPGSPTAAEPPPPREPEQFVTADGRVDLTVGWDELDRTLVEATPSGDVNGFDELIAEVDADGIAPFNPLAGAADEEWEPFDEDDFAEWEAGADADQVADVVVADRPAVAPEPAAPEPPTLPEVAEGTPEGDDLLWPEDLAAGIPTEAPPSEEMAGSSTESEPAAPPSLVDMGAVQALTVRWDTIEEELAVAVPPFGAPAEPDGVETLETLETFDDVGLVPFDFAVQAEGVDPLANPDAVGAPLDFDDLLLVTSQDATAPLGGGYGTAEATGMPAVNDRDQHGTSAFSIDHPPPAQRHEWTASQPTVEALEGIEPFAFDDAGPTVSDELVDFSDIEDVPHAAVIGDVNDFALFDDALGDDEAETASGAIGEAGDGWEVDLAAPGLTAAEPDWGEAEISEQAAGRAEPDVGAEQPAEPREAEGPASSSADAQPVEVADAGDVAADVGAVAADAPLSSSWPAFISGTSELIDRSGEVGALFARLREERASLVGLGMLRIDRALARRTPSVSLGAGDTGAASHGSNGHANEPGITTADLIPVRPVEASGGVEPAPSERPRLAVIAPETGAEIGTWRERLKLGRAEAETVVAEIEERIAATGPEPVYLRVLGEAFLKLGRPDLAAAQFRAATARRVRRL